MFKKQINILCVFLIIFSLCLPHELNAAESVSKMARTLLQSGLDAIQRSEYSQAINDLSQVLLLNPNHQLAKDSLIRLSFNPRVPLSQRMKLRAFDDLNLNIDQLKKRYNYYLEKRCPLIDNLLKRGYERYTIEQVWLQTRSELESQLVEAKTIQYNPKYSIDGVIARLKNDQERLNFELLCLDQQVNKLINMQNVPAADFKFQRKDVQPKIINKKVKKEKKIKTKKVKVDKRIKKQKKQRNFEKPLKFKKQKSDQKLEKVNNASVVKKDIIQEDQSVKEFKDLVNELKYMRKEMSAKEQRIQSLESDLAYIYSNAIYRIEGFNEFLLKRDVEISELKNKLESPKRETPSAAQALLGSKESEEEVELISPQMELLKEELVELQSRFELGQKIIDEKNAQIEMLEKELVELKKKGHGGTYETWEDVIKKKDNQLVELAGMLEIYKAKLNEAIKNKEFDQSDLLKLESDVKAINSQLLARESELESAKGRFTDINEQLDSIEDELRNLKEGLLSNRVTPTEASRESIASILEQLAQMKNQLQSISK